MGLVPIVIASLFVHFLLLFLALTQVSVAWFCRTSTCSCPPNCPPGTCTGWARTSTTSSGTSSASTGLPLPGTNHPVMYVVVDFTLYLGGVMCCPTPGLNVLKPISCTLFRKLSYSVAISCSTPQLALLLYELL